MASLAPSLLLLATSTLIAAPLACRRGEEPAPSPRDAQTITPAGSASAPVGGASAADAQTITATAASFDGSRALQLEGLDLAPCRAIGTARGAGHVTITFDQAGAALDAVVDAGPFRGAMRECIARAFSHVRVTPKPEPARNDGGLVRVGKSFAIN